MLIGRFDPESATKIIDITPSDIWRFNDYRDKSSATFKHDGWVLSTDEIESLDVNDLLLPLLNIVYPKKKQIVDICNKFGIKSEISIEVYSKDRAFPAIHFDIDTIKRIVELNAELDIDIVY